MTVTSIKSFIKRVTGDSSRIWEITVPQADGRQAFYKLAISPVKEGAFRKAWEEGRTVNLRDFGEIVESYFLPNSATIQPTTV